MDLNTITDLAPATGRAAQRAFRPGDAWLAGGTWLFSEPQPRLRRRPGRPGDHAGPAQLSHPGHG